mgnify:CR=1 FL=1
MPTKTAKKEKNILDSVKYTNMFKAYGAFWCRGFTEWAGTSSRSEYWWSYLMTFLIFIVWLLCVVVVGTFEYAMWPFWWHDVMLMPGVAILALLFVFGGMAMFIPWISMTVRRLHDVGLSAWWMMLWLLAMVPGLAFFVSVVFFVFSILPTKVEGNPYHKFNKQ